MEAKVRFYPRLQKWEAYVRFTGILGKQVMRSRLFESSALAYEALPDLVEKHKGESQERLKASSGKPPYVCPECGEEKLFKNRRIVRIEGRPTAICITCHLTKYPKEHDDKV